MEIAVRRSTLALAVLSIVIAWPRSVNCAFENLHPIQDTTISKIVRQHNGDVFLSQGSSCSQDVCVGISSGTATLAGNDTVQQPAKGTCPCQCHSHLPAFREDLRICVDDIHECILAPFVSGSTSQQIPFVFLPLKGQIIHPSKEISFAGIQTPVCAVSGAKFLTEGGWVDLRNPGDTDVPFRLFRDEGRTFLQWTGETELRLRMSGRLVLVHLMCRELATENPLPPERLPFFSPCVAFRVVGSPTKYVNNMNEVLFSADSRVDASNNGLSMSEYVAIGISSVLLGFIYVSSVLLYLHIRKRRREKKKEQGNYDDKSLTTMEEGVVKNNPLLGFGRHFSAADFNESGSSDTEMPTDVKHHEDKHKQTTSALVHSQYNFERRSACVDITTSDSSSIERLPEENVSIVETLEGREDRPDTVKAITGSTRRKLYFNPAYFEPHLLLTPPPAAIEFLTKIREVITIAKQKMATKKYIPSLLGIPEEDASLSVEPTYDNARPLGSRRGSMISLKRENSRRRTCSGCPGCEPQDFKPLCGKLPEFPTLAACQNCSTTTSESKKQSIQKWLENIPILRVPQGTTEPDLSKNENKQPKRLRSPARSLTSDQISPPILRALSPRPASERGCSSEKHIYEEKPLSVCSKTPSDSCIVATRRRRRSNAPRKVVCKPNTPPPPIPRPKSPQSDKSSSKSSTPRPRRLPPLPPPDMISNAIAIQNNVTETKVPTITKKKMNAVINEFTMHQSFVNERSDESPPLTIASRHKFIDYETDSLERSKNKGGSTPTDYGEMSSSQPSPSMSSALPLDEEMTMRNAIFNKMTGSMTISKLNMDMLQSVGDDYELVVLKKPKPKKETESVYYNLPKLIQKDNGYSLVSEVYVNNGYNYSSAPSTPSQSTCSTMEKCPPKIRYDHVDNKPGRILIEVEDCADHYIPANESDDFEPDTLDRKSKQKLRCVEITEFVDSLERPNQILLRSSGSFKKSMHETPKQDHTKSNFNRNFGSLREIYEAKVRNSIIPHNGSFRLKTDSPTWIFPDKTSEAGRILTLEERHSKRQRRSSPSVPPDVIPPPPHDNSPLYEQPKPPRKVVTDKSEGFSAKPPLPPKNGRGRSTGPKSPPKDATVTKLDFSTGTSGNLKNSFSQIKDVEYKNCINRYIIKTEGDISPPKSPTEAEKIWRKFEAVTYPSKPEDSGYLSTDSNEGKIAKKNINFGGGSETDESMCDAHSESGAESIETHSVFFGSFRKSARGNESGDSGVVCDIKDVEPTTITVLADDGSSTDSETISYATVVPFRNIRSRNSFRK